MHRFFQRKNRTARKDARRRARLAVEMLESRRLLSVTFHGGPLLDHVQVQTVYDGPAWGSTATLQDQANQLDQFVTYLVDSPYMDVLHQYNVGHGTFVNHDIVAAGPVAGSTVDDTQIQQTLAAEIKAGNLHAPNGETLYIVYTPPRVVVTDGVTDSVHDFAGYHSAFTDASGQTIYYAVIANPIGNSPDQFLNVFQQLTDTTSHELVEGATDPDTLTGWFDGTAGNQGEIGDLANGQYGEINGYTVTFVWSNANNAAILPAPVSATLQAQGRDIHATTGQEFKGVVAGFFDTDSSLTADNFTASIDWGDGTTSDGTIAPVVLPFANPLDRNFFSVSGTHTFAKDGTFNLTVTIKSSKDGTTAVATGTATVATPEPAELEARGVPIEATAGQAFTGPVAAFNDSEPNATVDQFTATITWGDGHTSTGTIQQGYFAEPVPVNGGDGVLPPALPPPPFLPPPPNPYDRTFHVFGTNTYDHGGSFPVHVTIHDTKNNLTAAADTVADVQGAEQGNLHAFGLDVEAVTGQAFTANVAAFVDRNNADAANFTAIIDWGDGSTSAGTIVPQMAVMSEPLHIFFNVQGTHTYATDGHFAVTVTIHDQADNLDVAVTSVARVHTNDHQNLLAFGTDIEGQTGQAFSGRVAGFIDTAPNPTASQFTATIDWGDGQTSAGVVSAANQLGEVQALGEPGDNPTILANLFQVTGTHTYAKDGSFTVTVTITETATGASAKTTSTATIETHTNQIIGHGHDITPTAGTPFDGAVAGFADTAAGVLSTDLSATIDWGDGHKTDGVVTHETGPIFTVHGVNTYDKAGTFTITVSLHDTANNLDGTATSTAFVTAADHTPPPPDLNLVATLFTHSVEFFQNVLKNLYQQDLGRTPDQPGLNFWLQAMQNGMTDEHIEASFLGSPEYIANHGGTGSAWVQGMYHDLLGRSPDQAGLKFWDNALANGAQPQAVALGFAASPEREGQRVAKDYLAYLGRPASASEINYWVGQFAQGVRNETLVANFVSAPEYFQNQRRGAADVTNWVSSAYQDVFHRNATAEDVRYWSQVIE
jgi:hypothetical protein